MFFFKFDEVHHAWNEVGYGRHVHNGERAMFNCWKGDQPSSSYAVSNDQCKMVAIFF